VSAFLLGYFAGGIYEARRLGRATPYGRSARQRRETGQRGGDDLRRLRTGRARLRCGEEARRTHDDGLMVYLWCANDVHPRGAYQYFTIPAGENIGA
jgi:hypothetical protein